MSHAKNKVEWCLNKENKKLQEAQEAPNTAISLREEYQYSTRVSLENNEYQKLLSLAKHILDKTKDALEG